jgi:hypothetical protein
MPEQGKHIENLRYDEVILATDADANGLHPAIAGQSAHHKFLQVLPTARAGTRL